ncbi:hypothetical protein BJX76DRAFT_360086 [Aspergillus varians]
MAELFGAVLDAFTSLEQIVESIERLKALRKFIRSIPHELQDLIDEIEFVQAVLKTLTPDMFDFLNVVSSERRLHAFQSDLEVLISKVRKYHLFATGRQIAAMKLALKKEEIHAQR